MNEAGEMFENAILHWRDAAGIGTALIPTILNDKLMVLGVLQRIYARSSTCKTIIITNDFFETLKITFLAYHMVSFLRLFINYLIVANLTTLLLFLLQHK